MRQFGRLALALLLVLGIASSAVANCLPETSAGDQMECCVKGEHNCEPSMRAADCCTSPSSTSQKLVLTKPVAPTKPIVAVVLVTASARVGSFEPRVGHHPSVILTSSSPPRFLLASSLRI